MYVFYAKLLNKSPQEKRKYYVRRTGDNRPTKKIDACTLASEITIEAMKGKKIYSRMGELS